MRPAAPADMASEISKHAAGASALPGLTAVCHLKWTHAPTRNSSGLGARESRSLMDLTPAKREILKAAAECFMEQGFRATSIDVLARRMGATGEGVSPLPIKVGLFFDVHRAGHGPPVRSGPSCHSDRSEQKQRDDGLIYDETFRSNRHCRCSNGDGNALEVLVAMMKAHAMALFERHAFESVRQ